MGRLPSQLIVVVVLSLMPGPATRALANESTDRAEAKRLKDLGTAALDSGRYAEALNHFEKAYEVFHSPNLRFNIGLALRSLGRPREAAAHFEAFLAEAPNAPAEARAIARTSIDAVSAPPQHSPPSQSPNSPPPDTSESLRRPSWARRHVPSLTVGSIGLAALVSALGTGLGERSVRDNLAAQCIGHECPASLSGEIGRVQALAVSTDVLWSVGAAAVVIAVILYAVESRRPALRARVEGSLEVAF